MRLCGQFYLLAACNYEANDSCCEFSELCEELRVKLLLFEYLVAFNLLFLNI